MQACERGNYRNTLLLVACIACARTIICSAKMRAHSSPACCARFMLARVLVLQDKHSHAQGSGLAVAVAAQRVGGLQVLCSLEEGQSTAEQFSTLAAV